MGKSKTELQKLATILQTDIDNVVNIVNKPPINVTITFVNGRLFINSNLNIFNLTDAEKIELLGSMLTDSLNLLRKNNDGIGVD